ncbi:MAG: ATP-binding cassette domain-containing protein [Oscillospiraceae bacterium]|nr:ATP-binding cassette domain-containing protein [Oscillospiraceae bacterium]
MENNDKKVLLSAKDVHLQFKVRGRVLTAIRGISLDIYEEESIAIVGESGSGKSVFTKCFTGMNDQNGYISGGEIIFNDPELSDTHVALSQSIKKLESTAYNKLNEYSKLELGAETYKKIVELESEKRGREGLSSAELNDEQAKEKDLIADRTDAYNLKQTLDPKKDKAEIKELSNKISYLDSEIKKLRAASKTLEAEHKRASKADASYLSSYNEKMASLKAQYQSEISGSISEETIERNEILAKEICLSIGRYGTRQRYGLFNNLLKALKKAMKFGVDLNDENARNAVFDTVAFRVAYLDETDEALHGTCVLNLANVKFGKDWAQIRGRRIATVFQDPMTSLNPIITIGKQITSIIIKHQGCSEVEARRKALELMHKVGIPNPEKRFDDYPFQYSGGMRQRIVIAIALSCQPKILICDEPTTALDVTIQAQILKLIKDLQKDFHYTIVFITHDLGVVANIADRVAVLYAGQIVELGTVEEVFYDPKHPYTWALLSSLPQLTQRNTKLYSITGTPPSLYNEVVGDAFAPRNPYCLKIDTLEEPPMYQVTETHYAKTWLLDPDAPKVEKPEAIEDIHGKLIRAFNI